MSKQAPSFHEATSIALRVKAILSENSYGFEASQAAWQFAHTINTANAVLKHCAAKLGQDNATDAYVSFVSNRHVVETVETLELDAISAWSERCKRFAWTQPDALKASIAEILNEAFTDIRSQRASLVDEYGRRIHRKGLLEGYPVIRLLANSFPEDAGLQSELGRVSKELANALEADLIVCSGSNKASDETLASLARHRAAGFVIESRPGPIQDALFEERMLISTRKEKEIHKLEGEAEKLADGPEWRDLESRFFALNQRIVEAPLPPDAANGLMEKLHPLRERLARKRAFHDGAIAIADTLDQLAAKPKDAALAETFRNQLSHASFRGVTFPEELQARIESTQAALPAAAKPKTPKAPKAAKAPRESSGKSKTPLLLIGGCAAALAVGAFFAFSGGSSPEPQVAKATQAAPVSDELSEAVSALQRAARSAYDPKSDAPFQAVLEKARRLAQSQPERQELAAQIDAAEAQHLQKRSDHLARLAANAAQTLEKADAAVRHAFSRAGSPDFTAARKAAQDAIEAAQASEDLGTNSQAHTERCDLLAQQLASAESFDSVYKSSLGALASAESLDDFFSGLETLGSSPELAASDQTDVRRLIDLRPKLSASLSHLGSFNELAPESPLRREAFSLDTLVELDADEQELLAGLIDQTCHAETYLSTVKHYQGSSEHASEQQAYLAEPVTFTEQALSKRTNFTFAVRGFDEDGHPLENAYNANYARAENGEGWGHFYEPSTLANEASYYRDTLNPSLKQLLARPNPIKPIQIIDELAGQKSLSPLFRLYWIQQIESLMAQRPEKWPLRNVPALETARERLATSAPRNLSPTRWIAAGPRSSQAEALQSLLNEIAGLQIAKESAAFASLAQATRNGRFQIVGFVSPTGELQLRPDASAEERPWTIDARSGALAPLSDSLALQPYAPALAYRISGADSRQILSSALKETGVDLLQTSYRNHLPRVLRQ